MRKRIYWLLPDGEAARRTMNELLLARTLELLPRALTPRKLPVNDGAIAYGQAAIAARRARSRTR